MKTFTQRFQQSWHAFAKHGWLSGLVLGWLHALCFAMPHGWWLQSLLMALLLLLAKNCCPSQHEQPDVSSTSAAQQSQSCLAKVATKNYGRLAWLGFGFGLGWFAHGLAWLHVSMHEFGGMPSIFAWIALLVFAGYLALFVALAFALYARMDGLNGWWKLAAWAALWAASEWLRGWLFSGFPWLQIGYAHTLGPLAGFAPIGGVLLVTWCAAVLAWLMAELLTWRGAALGRRQALACLAVLLLLGQGLRLINWSEPTGKSLSVALLQGNIEQSKKFEGPGLTQSLTWYTHWLTTLKDDLIITPETAIPIPLADWPQDQRLRLEQTAKHQTLFIGAPWYEPSGYVSNAVLAMQDGVIQLYEKHHLVPFGEFIPDGFRWFTRMMKIPLGDFNRGDLLQPNINVKGVIVATSICYEDLFGNEWRARFRKQMPEILLNQTNLAWFGNTDILPQHIEIGRMRALEFARPFLRATNAGTTLFIGPDGVLQASLAAFQAGVLQVKVNAYQGLTPYMYVGNWLVLVLLMVPALRYWLRVRQVSCQRQSMSVSE